MRRGEASPLLNTICTVFFAVFVFIYIFAFQKDMLFYAQHVLSEGNTVFQPLIGALIITMLGVLLALCFVRPLCRHLYKLPALYFVPSALILAALTDIHVVPFGSQSVFGHIWIVAAVLLVLFCFVDRLMKNMPIATGYSSSTDQLGVICMNLFVMLFILCGMISMGNTNEIDHMHMKAQSALRGRQYEEASLVGKWEGCSSEKLTMIRGYALGKCGQLGEHFFEYPIAGNSSALLPTKNNRLEVFPEMRLYQFIGGIPNEGMDARECLRLLEKRGCLRSEAKDYLYIACLIDKDIDAFARYLEQDYDTTMVLPKHYREALTLHNHLRANPVIEYSLPEMEADFADFQEMIKKNPDKVLRESALRDSYGNTYWYYYYFRKE